jgi:hypothetical protein
MSFACTCGCPSYCVYRGVHNELRCFDCKGGAIPEHILSEKNFFGFFKYRLIGNEK